MRPTILRRQRPRGIAALTVVMVLFFIVAMVAAYTNRTLILEQRGATNVLRAAQALDAADAGVEWALAQLNGPRLTAACASSSTATDLDFRSRYLTLNTDGSYAIPYYGIIPYSPSCVANNGVWTCSCPSGTGASALPTLAPTATGNGQAFRAYFMPLTNYNVSPITRVGPGVVLLNVQGCSNLGSGVTSCIQPLGGPLPQVDAYNRFEVWLGLVKALPSVPPAALTAGGSIVVSGGTLSVTNADPATGWTVHSANAVNPGASLQLAGPAGTPSAAAVLRADGDPTLPPQRGGNPVMFDATFGMDAATYSRQPGVVFVDCSAGCNAASLDDALARYPSRVIWANGDLSLDASGASTTFGSAAAPAMIVASGTVTINSPITYNGFLYGNAIVIAGGGAGAAVNGAVVSTTDFTATASASVTYNAAILNLIRVGYGSFVRVPGATGQF